MTIEEAEELIEEETKKLKALKEIVKILAWLGEDAREWILEKITE